MNFPRLPKCSQLGYAPIELGVLIGFMFIIGAFLLFLIDPIERAAKVRDTRLQTDAEQMVEGISSYRLKQGRYPWATGVDLDPSPAIPWKLARAPELGLCANDACSEAGVVVKSELLAGNFHERDSVIGRNGEIYIGKSKGEAGKLYACFVPSSKSLRQQTGKLYKLILEQEVPASMPVTCAANTTWTEENICYYCVIK